MLNMTMQGFCEGSKLEAFYKCWDRSAAECEEDKTCTLDYVKAYFDVRNRSKMHMHYVLTPMYAPEALPPLAG